jgi:thymidylate synthase
MYSVEYTGINSALVGLAQLLLECGVERATRGETCIELPAPICITITNPLSRIITIKERGWNIFLPYAESLWLASGRNNLDFIEYYLPKMAQFSDDNRYIRGGYGPRLRHYNGSTADYKNPASGRSPKSVDQFRYIEECFKKDPFTRQGIIDIGDPVKDSFGGNGNLKVTKDIPCTRTLTFQRSVAGKLNLTVYMRSNDLIWGTTGVNIFNYTFMQVYFAAILGLEVGHYYHIVNNLHYYPNRHQSLVEKIARIENVRDESYDYTKTFSSLDEFDALISKLKNWETKLRKGATTKLMDFNDDFFNDWAKILYAKSTNRKTIFSHPVLNNLLNTSI